MPQINQTELDNSTHCKFHGVELSTGAYGKYCLSCWNEMYELPKIEPSTLQHIQAAEAVTESMMQEAERIARARKALHDGHASRRILTPNYENIGIIGELFFARKYGLDIDRELRPTGDNGIDFIINGHTIDIKTLQDDRELLVEKGTAKAEIFVLCHYSVQLFGNPVCKLIGWAYKAEVLVAPIKKVLLVNHAIPAYKLHPITELEEYLLL